MEGISTIGSGTVAGALEYLEFLSSKGHVAPGAITALRTGFSKVMETVGGADWKKVDVRNIDLEEHMTRFGNMTHGKYNSKSLLDYKSRVNKVLTWYAEFLKTPGWTPNVKPRARVTSVEKAAAKSKSVPSELTSPEERHVEPARELPIQPSPAQSSLIAFPFPLSDGTLASLYLPSMISAHDAKRMARFIETLVIEEAVPVQQVQSQGAEM